MYRQSIFITLVSIVFGFSLSVFAGKANSPTPKAAKKSDQTLKGKSSAAVAVRKEVLVMFTNYLSETKDKNLQQKLQSFETLKKLMKSYRQSKPIATPDDEIFMDTLEGVMSTFPESKDFKLSECKAYRAQMQSQFQLGGPGEQNSAATEYAELWHHLCDE